MVRSGRDSATVDLEAGPAARRPAGRFSGAGRE